MANPFDVYDEQGGGGANPFDSFDAPSQSDGGSFLGDLGAGALRGASSIGATLIAPFEAAFAGTGQSGAMDARKNRLSAVDENLRAMGADTESIPFAAGKIGAEIAGTAGMGSAVARMAAAAGASPAVIAALESGGFSLGNAAATTGREMLKNAGLRVGSGAAVGGASAGLINPSDVGTGAAIGAALPVAVRAGGELGKLAKATIYDPIANKDKIIGGMLSRTIGNNTAANLRMPATPGVTFSAGEATGNPGLAALEDTMKAINPSGALNVQAQANRTALAGRMRGLAQDEDAISAAIQARTAAASPFYRAAEQSQVPVDVERVTNLIDGIIQKNPANQALVTPLKGIRKTLFESTGSPARTVITDRAGNPVNFPMPQEPRLRSFLDEVKKAGGINSAELSDIGADISNKSYPGLFRKNGGMTMDRLAEFADQRGWLVSGQIDDLERNGVGGSLEYVRDMIRSGLAKEHVMHPADWDAANAFQEAIRNAEQAGLKVNSIPAVPAKLRENQRELMSAIDNIKAQLGKQENAYVRRELNTVKRALEHQMTMADPAFKTAEKTFAEMSKPINQMQIMQKLRDKLIPATAGDAPSRLNANQLAQSMRNRDQVARGATGFRRARYDKVMTPEQSAAINGIVGDSSRIAEMNSLGAGFGSPTARRQSLANLVSEHISDQAPGTSALLRGMGNVPLIGIVPRGVQAAGSGLTNMIGKRANDQMLAMLEEALANNPAQVRQFLQAYQQPQLPGRISSLLSDPRLQAVMRTAPIAAIP